jgi:ABC-2 type transport system ATP-binding protein
VLAPRLAMPVEQEQFWSQISTQYDAVVDAQLGRDLRRLVRERLSKEADLGDAVELGCGSGYFTEALARNAQTLVATDVAPGMLDVARQTVGAAGDVRFQVEDCQKTSFADGTFQTAFMALVLQFVDADVALAEIRRILAPGGALIIATLDVLALPLGLRLMLLARTIYYARVKYRRPMPRISLKQLPSAAQLCAKLENIGFRIATLEKICDRSRSYNCPVSYAKAVKV